MNRRAAFEIVDAFENALCEYTGAPHAVAVDSCTNALYLALKWWGEAVTIPAHTYVGVVQAARNAGVPYTLIEDKWVGSHRLAPSPIVDAAKDFRKDSYTAGEIRCVSFQACKRIPIGRGGAILHDNPELDVWLRKARFDGRIEGADYHNPTFGEFGCHMYMPPPDAARGLWLLTYVDDDDQADWTEYPDLREATWL